MGLQDIFQSINTIRYRDARYECQVIVNTCRSCIYTRHGKDMMGMKVGCCTANVVSSKVSFSHLFMDRRVTGSTYSDNDRLCFYPRRETLRCCSICSSELIQSLSRCDTDHCISVAAVSSTGTTPWPSSRSLQARPGCHVSNLQLVAPRLRNAQPAESPSVSQSSTRTGVHLLDDSLL